MVVVCVNTWRRSCVEFKRQYRSVWASENDDCCTET